MCTWSQPALTKSQNRTIPLISFGDASLTPRHCLKCTKQQMCESVGFLWGGHSHSPLYAVIWLAGRSSHTITPTFTSPFYVMPLGCKAPVMFCRDSCYIGGPLSSAAMAPPGPRPRQSTPLFLRYSAFFVGHQKCLGAQIDEDELEPISTFVFSRGFHAISAGGMLQLQPCAALPRVHNLSRKRITKFGYFTLLFSRCLHLAWRCVCMSDTCEGVVASVRFVFLDRLWEWALLRTLQGLTTYRGRHLFQPTHPHV